MSFLVEVRAILLGVQCLPDLFRASAAHGAQFSRSRLAFLGDFVTCAFALHYIALDCIALRCVALRCIMLHYVAVHAYTHIVISTYRQTDSQTDRQIDRQIYIYIYTYDIYIYIHMIYIFIYDIHIINHNHTYMSFFGYWCIHTYIIIYLFNIHTIRVCLVTVCYSMLRIVAKLQYGQYVAVCCWYIVSYLYIPIYHL
jgi:hypothetical protein